MTGEKKCPCEEVFCVETPLATVLCIDDEPNILALRDALLRMAGYKVHVCDRRRDRLGDISP